MWHPKKMRTTKLSFFPESTFLLAALPNQEILPTVNMAPLTVFKWSMLICLSQPTLYNFYRRQFYDEQVTFPLKKAHFSTESCPSCILRPLCQKTSRKYLNIIFLPIFDFGNCWILQLKFCTLKEITWMQESTSLKSLSSAE